MIDFSGERVEAVEDQYFVFDRSERENITVNDSEPWEKKKNDGRTRRGRPRTGAKTRSRPIFFGALMTVGPRGIDDANNHGSVTDAVYTLQISKRTTTCRRK